MNILQVQDRLKGLSEQQLAQEMQMPSGMAPQFLVLSELQRRKRVRDDFQAQQGLGQMTTVAQDAVAAAGVPQAPMAQMATAMAPQTDISQNTGIASLPVAPAAAPEEPQRMADGGMVRKMQGGRAVASFPQEVLTDNALIAMANRMGMSVSEYLSQMDPAQAGAIVRSSKQRAARDRMSALEPSAIPSDSAQFIPVNPSYVENLNPVFPNEPTAPESGGLAIEPQPLYPPIPVGNPIPGVRPEGGFYDQPPAPEPMSPMDRIRAGMEYRDRVAQTRNTMDEMVAAREQERAAALLGPAFEGVGRGAVPGESDYDRIMRAAAATTAPGFGQGLPTGPAPIPPGGLSRQAQFEPSYPESPEAPRTFYQPPPAPDRSGVMGTNEVPDVAGAVAAIPELLQTEVRIGPDGSITQVPPTTEAGATELQNPALRAAVAGRATPEAEAAADAAAPVADDTPDGGGSGGGGSGSGSGSGGSGGSGGMTSYEQAIADALARADKRANQDKWLALAQAGMALMASKQPTLGGALGEAGASGLAAFRQSRDEAEKTKMDLMGTQFEIDLARQKLAASGGGGGLTAYQMYQMDRNARSDELDRVKALQEYAAGLDPSSAEYLDIQAALSDYYMGGSGAGANNYRTPSAG